MLDLAHLWGGDLTVAPHGDLHLADDEQLTRERVIRRLMTNRQDYLWHLPYGAGLPKAVGRAVTPGGVAALVRTHLRQEPAVSHSPLPIVDLVHSIENGGGRFDVSIQYFGAQSGKPSLVQIPTSEDGWTSL